MESLRLLLEPDLTAVLGFLICKACSPLCFGFLKPPLIWNGCISLPQCRSLYLSRKQLTCFLRFYRFTDRRQFASVSDLYFDCGLFINVEISHTLWDCWEAWFGLWKRGHGNLGGAAWNDMVWLCPTQISILNCSSHNSHLLWEDSVRGNWISGSSAVVLMTVNKSMRSDYFEEEFPHTSSLACLPCKMSLYSFFHLPLLLWGPPNMWNCDSIKLFPFINYPVLGMSYLVAWEQANTTLLKIRNEE